MQSHSPTTRSSGSQFGKDVVRLRLAVGMLGERTTPVWWQSSFMSQSASAFLEPIFGSKRPVAQYNGITEAARLVHDERIGVGRVFHLFRLPEATEQSLTEEINQDLFSEMEKDGSSDEWAMGVLQELASGESEPREGPVQISVIASMMNQFSLEDAASHYRKAFQRGVQVFPYFSDRL
jgi:hypothetical protein